MSGDMRSNALDDGTAAYHALWGMAGASQAAANPVLFPADPRHYFLPAGVTTLTRAMLGGFAPILTAVNPSASSITVPTLATMGLTVPSDGTYIPSFRYRALGAGNLAINPASGVKFIYNGYADPTTFTRYGGVGTNKYSSVYTLMYCGIDPDDATEVWVA